MKIKQTAERLNSVCVRKKAKRLLALTMAVLMVNPVTGYGVSAHAQEVETITAFAKLSSEFATQQLAVGADEADINLPDTLNVTISDSSSDTSGSEAENDTAIDNNVEVVVDSSDAPSAETTNVDGMFYSYGGDISTSGLNLSSNAPTTDTSYKAGNGYVLFTPANGETPANITLQNATIESNTTPLNLNVETIITLKGTNTLTNTTSDGGVGIFAGSNGTDMPITIEGNSQASLEVNAWQCTNIGVLTVDNATVTMNGSTYGIVATGDVLLTNGTKVTAAGGEFGAALQVGRPPMGGGDIQEPPSAFPSLTVQGGSTLTVNGDAMITGGLSVDNESAISISKGNCFIVLASNNSPITNSGTIDNKGTVLLPFTLTAQQVNALGIGGEVILIDPNDQSVPGKEYIYVGETLYLRSELSSRLDLKTGLPEEATYFKLNSGNHDCYILFTPANGRESPVITLHDVDNIGYLTSGIKLPSDSITFHLEGVNFIDSITGDGNIAITGNGRLDTEIIRVNDTATLTIADEATADVLHRTGALSGTSTYTLYGNRSDSIEIYQNDRLILTPGAVLTLEATYQQTLGFAKNTALSTHLEIGKGAKIVNNSTVVLPQGTTAEQIKALPLTGNGVVMVPTAYGDEGEPTEGDTYRNDGTTINPIDGLDLIDDNHSDKTVETDGYAWDTSTNTLTLGDAVLGGEIKLPATVTINTIAPSTIVGSLQAPSGETLHLTLSGTSPLNIMGGISGNADGDAVTVQGGAKVTAGRISIGSSSGANGTLNVTGAGTSLTVSEQYSSAVYCQTINVTDGATLTASSEHGVGVMAMSGNVTVTGGATLTTNCKYGVYIIDGKLTVDANSKLITNGTVAPFCIVDKTSSKVQGDVLALPGIPDGTQIASVTGTSTGSARNYWSIVPTNGNLSVSNENSEPADLSGAKKEKLTFVKASAGGNDDNGGGSYSVVITSEKKPDQPVIGSVNDNGKVSGNHAVIIITDSMVQTAIEKAQSTAKAQRKTKNGIGVEISISAPDAKSFTIITERAALNHLVSTNIKLFQITGLPVRFCFEQNALKQQQTQGTGDTTMVIQPAKVKGVRNAYDITLSTIKDGKTVGITSLGNGGMTLSLSYTLGKGEALGGLYAVSLDSKGNATRIAGSAYDANSGCVIFTTTHFSPYGIGYTAPTAKFTDISTHWAKESIDYVVGRRLLSGSSKTAFSPNAAMTREMLVTALGRLAGVDTKAYTKNSFTDVKADSAYRPYIEWAYSKGIIQGIEGNQFAPDRAITREEIAVIFANYAKATGYTLPITREASAYADTSSIGSAYKDAVKAMQQAGIMMGGSDNKFNPKTNATRAEVSSMLGRYIKLTINPATAQGWEQNDAGQYLYYKDGKALTGTQTIDGVKYFFNTDGTLKTGWIKDGDNWRFYSGKTMLVGFWKLGKNGKNKTYYFTKDGLMVSGKWFEIDGKWYYFYADGSLARNTEIDGYEVDKNGVRKTK